MTDLNRRIALTAVAVLPARRSAAVAAIDAPDADVFAAGRAVEEAWHRLGEACDTLGVADEAMQEWERSNPKPVMRKFTKTSERERENWIRLVAEEK